MTQKPNIRTANTPRETGLVHPEGFRRHAASRASPVTATGIKSSSVTPSPLASTTEAEVYLTRGAASLPAGTAWVETPRYEKGQNASHKNAAHANP